jgi:putative hemolysin
MDFLFILILLLFNGVLAMAEIAIVSSRKIRLQKMAESGNANAQLALNLAKKPSAFLSTVQIGITLVGILIGAVGEGSLVDRLSDILQPLPVLGLFHEAISFVVVISMITYVSLLIGEIVPKRIALNNPEAVASYLAPFMSALATVTRPLVKFLSISTEALLKLLRMKPMTNAPVTEEEVRVLIGEGTKSGIFNKMEKELIERTLTLDDLRVSALITPRNQIEWFDIAEFKKKASTLLNSFTHSRIILCKETLDKVLGVIYVEDYLRHAAKSKNGDIKKLMDKPLFIPENMRALKALEMFRHATHRMAFVVDEFGNVQGLITFTDVLEALVGPIDNTEKDTETDIVKRKDGSFLIDGMVSTDILKEVLQVDKLPREQLEVYQTLGGFIISYLDRIPKTGDVFRWNGFRMEIMDMDEHRIDRVLVKQEPKLLEAANNHNLADNREDENE